MKRFIFILIISVFVSGCATFLNPLTGKKETILLDTPYEVALGGHFSRQVAGQYKIEDGFEYNDRIQVITRKLVSVCDRKDLAYQVKVIKNKQMNAFAMPGGFIYVNTGLMDSVDDDELAGVLAHEMGHVVARHGVKKLAANLGAGVVMSIVLRSEDDKELQQLVATGFTLVTLGYSRQDEYQADKLAIKYTYLAGYNPRGVVSLFEKLRREHGDIAGFEIWSSTHPPLSQRINHAEEQIKRYQSGG
ncbi:MAG: M48 family metalloprotease [PVC group bacterium]|nr:M48 family metalloprotease [PVC group bacterium]